MPNEDAKKESEDKKSDDENANENEKGENKKAGDEGDSEKNEEDSPQIKKLRKENAKKRIENKELRDKLANAEAKKASTENDDAKKDEKNKKTDSTDEIFKIVNKRYVRSELKAAALKAGLVDIDALKMFDISSLEIDSAGDVVGIPELIDEMKESKSYIFNQQAKDTTSDKKTPGDAAPSSKNAMDMTDDEYAVEAKKMGINVEDHC